MGYSGRSTPHNGRFEGSKKRPPQAAPIQSGWAIFGPSKQAITRCLLGSEKGLRGRSVSTSQPLVTAGLKGQKHPFALSNGWFEGSGLDPVGGFSIFTFETGHY